MIKVFYVDAFAQERYSGPFRLKGFELAKFDAVAFDYRQIGYTHGELGLNHSLLNSLRVFRPDVIFVNKGHFGINQKVLRQFLDDNPHTMLITWTGDQRGTVMDEVVPCAQLSHVLAHSNDDPKLAKGYNEVGVPNVIEHHCATDVEVYKPHDAWPQSMEGEVSFFGSQYGAYPLSGFRDEVLKAVDKEYDLKLYGGNWERVFPGKLTSQAHRDRYALAASGCNIQLCVNAFNNIHRYTSNRVWNALACERLVLQHHFAGAESLLGPGCENVVYFQDTDQCLALIDYYLAHKDEAQEIAARGRKFVEEAHTYYHRAMELKDIYDKWMEDDAWSFNRRG
jgi:hypothetical protein